MKPKHNFHLQMKIYIIYIYEKRPPRNWMISIYRYQTQTIVLIIES